MEILKKRPFTELLQDFGQPEPDDSGLEDGVSSEVDGEDVNAVPAEPLVEHTQDQIDALVQDAFERGFKKGSEAGLIDGTENVAASVKLFADTIAEGADRSRKAVEAASEAFLAVLVGSLSEVIGDNKLCSGLQRSIATDIKALVSECPGSVTIYVSADDIERIESEFHGSDNIKLLSEKKLRRGQVRLESGDNEFCIDHNAWSTQVREKLLSAIKTYSS